MADLGEWTLTVILPQGDGACMEYAMKANPKDTCAQLKQKIEKICGIPPDDMELFARNGEGKECKQKWLSEESTLQEQEVVDGAQIAVGVHGMRGGNNSEPVVDPETGEVADAVQASINNKGDTSYYFAHSKKCELSEEQRIVSGGSPLKISEGYGQALSEVDRPPAAEYMFEDEEAPGRPRKAIKNYAWGDEKEVVKIYISQDSEPDAIEAASDAKDGQVEVKFLEKALRLIVHGEKLDHVLLLENIYYETIPADNKFRVSPNKRITLSLKKKEPFTWLKLLKPE